LPQQTFDTSKFKDLTTAEIKNILIPYLDKISDEDYKILLQEATDYMEEPTELSPLEDSVSYAKTRFGTTDEIIDLYGNSKKGMADIIKEEVKLEKLEQYLRDAENFRNKMDVGEYNLTSVNIGNVQVNLETLPTFIENLETAIQQSRLFLKKPLKQQPNVKVNTDPFGRRSVSLDDPMGIFK
nr:hypothetical protein [Bacteroidota bacterium]